MKEGRLRAVVCTSSLDLGVDFLPVERVLQIGSAKGVARLLQRAGRSGHAPGRSARVTLVPTHSLELLEAAAAQARRGRAARRGADIAASAARRPGAAPGDGGARRRLRPRRPARRGPQRVRLPRPDRRRSGTGAWISCASGGPSLTAYPDYRRVGAGRRRRLAGAGCAAGAAPPHEHRHHRQRREHDRALLGQGGGRGRHRHRRGGLHRPAVPRRLLPLRRPAARTGAGSRDDGLRASGAGRQGGGAALERRAACRCRASLPTRCCANSTTRWPGRFDGPEMRALRPLLELQARWSALPATGRLLAETLRSREGSHLFLYPFAGRQVHLGIASLLAWRAGAGRRRPPSRSRSTTTASSCLSPQPIDWARLLLRRRGADAARRRPAAGPARQPQCGGTGAAPLSRDRPGLGAGLPGLPGRRQEHAPVAGFLGAVLPGVPAARPGQPAADAGRGGGAAPGAGGRPPGAGARSACAPAGCCCSRWRGLRRSPFRCSSNACARSCRPRSSRDRIERMLQDLERAADLPAAAPRAGKRRPASTVRRHDERAAKRAVPLPGRCRPGQRRAVPSPSTAGASSLHLLPERARLVAGRRRSCWSPTCTSARRPRSVRWASRCLRARRAVNLQRLEELVRRLGASPPGGAGRFPACAAGALSRPCSRRWRIGAGACRGLACTWSRATTTAAPGCCPRNWRSSGCRTRCAGAVRTVPRRSPSRSGRRQARSGSKDIFIRPTSCAAAPASACGCRASCSASLRRSCPLSANSPAMPTCSPKPGERVFVVGDGRVWPVPRFRLA